MQKSALDFFENPHFSFKLENRSIYCEFWRPVTLSCAKIFRQSKFKFDPRPSEPTMKSYFFTFTKKLTNGRRCTKKLTFKRKLRKNEKNMRLEGFIMSIWVGCENQIGATVVFFWSYFLENDDRSDLMSPNLIFER